MSSLAARDISNIANLAPCLKQRFVSARSAATAVSTKESRCSMAKLHRPLEIDLAVWIRSYLDRGGDPGELLTELGRRFPGTSYAVAGRALALAQGVHHEPLH
jgi:hypothetical protein